MLFPTACGAGDSISLGWRAAEPQGEGRNHDQPAKAGDRAIIFGGWFMKEIYLFLKVILSKRAIVTGT